MIFSNPVIITYTQPTIEHEKVSAILERKLKVLDSLGKVESTFRFPSATPYSNQMKTKPTKKLSYRQLVKRVNGLSACNQQLQDYLKISRATEQSQHDKWRAADIQLQGERDKVIALERKVNNLQQVIQNLAAAAVKTNEALGRM